MPQIDCRTFECVHSFVMAESEWLFGGFTHGGLTACYFGRSRQHGQKFEEGVCSQKDKLRRRKQRTKK